MYRCGSAAYAFWSASQACPEIAISLFARRISLDLHVLSQSVFLRMAPHHILGVPAALNA